MPYSCSERLESLLEIVTAFSSIFNIENRGCTFATVNTMDWEALPFYQKLGYEVECIRDGFEKA